MRGRWWRRIGIGVGVLFVVWAAFAVWLLGTAWSRVPGYEPAALSPAAELVLDGKAYGGLIDTHERPYVFDAPRGPGAVLVYGAEHTRDPSDPQITDIGTRWAAFDPTFALVESRLGRMLPAFMDPVETFAEPGAVAALAKHAGVPLHSWEPHDAVLVRTALDQGLTREQAALYFSLRPYFSNVRHGLPPDPEAFVRDTLNDARWPELRGILGSIDDVDAAWAKLFPDGPDWRDVSDQSELPGVFATLDLNLPRDRHLVSVIDELCARGERVFVICGSSHAVKIRPALEHTSGVPAP